MTTNIVSRHAYPRHHPRDHRRLLTRRRRLHHLLRSLPTTLRAQTKSKLPTPTSLLHPLPHHLDRLLHPHSHRHRLLQHPPSQTLDPVLLLTPHPRPNSCTHSLRPRRRRSHKLGLPQRTTESKFLLSSQETILPPTTSSPQVTQDPGPYITTFHGDLAQRTTESPRAGRQIKKRPLPQVQPNSTRLPTSPPSASDILARQTHPGVTKQGIRTPNTGTSQTHGYHQSRSSSLVYYSDARFYTRK